MIMNQAESRNFSASSVINDQVVANFSAYYTNDGRLNFATDIVSLTLYKANKVTVDKDEVDWKAEVEQAVFGE